MKGKTTTGSRRGMKQATLDDYSSPTKAPSPQLPASPSKAPKKDPLSKLVPRIKSKTKANAKRKRRKRRTDNAPDDSNSDDIGRIKLERKDKEPIQISDSSSSSESESEGEDSDNVPMAIPAKRFMKLKTFIDVDESEEEQQPAPKRLKNARHHSEEDSEEVNAHKRRRLTRQRKVPVAEPKDSDEEDIDDLEQEHVLESRLRERNKKTAFQKNLEKLKKIKQKLPISSSSGEEEEEESDEPAKPFKGAIPHHSAHSLFGTDDEEGKKATSSESSESESDFIVEDGPLGAPLLPAEFSMETHQDLSHQFKKIFQFFVHIAVQPAGKRKNFMEKNMEDEEYFSVPLEVTRRKLSSLRDSLVTSSVWKPEFRKALERYPDFSLTRLEITIPGCDACHLGRRVSTFVARLGGRPYYRIGFRPLRRRMGSYDSDDSDSNEGALKTEFNLGRFCARRAQVYHEFSHWEVSLFTTINSEIEVLRSMETKEEGMKFYTYAGGKEPPEDLTDADEICEWLDERKIIDMEWQRIRAMMESAEHLEMEGRRKGGEED